MKYFAFCLAVLGIVPGALLMATNRYLLRWAVMAMLLCTLFFDKTALNFFSRELYRGTSRGMEVSLIYIIAVMVLVTISMLHGKPMRLVPEGGALLYVLYFLFCLPSLHNAGSFVVAFFELWKMIMIYLVYLAIYYYLEYTKGDFDTILYALAIVNLFNFYMCVRMHLQGIYQPGGIFPHRNSMAMFMSMTGLLFLARAFTSHHIKETIFFVITFLATSAALVRSYSRGAIICYPAAAILTISSAWMNVRSVKKFYLTALVAILGLVGLALFLPRVVERFETASESSWGTRKNLAVAARNMIKDKPFLGVGINNWGYKINPPYTYSEHRDKRPGADSDDFQDGIVETIYLLVAAECGLICFTILLCWFLYYLFHTMQLARLMRFTPYFYIPAGLLGGLSAIFVQSVLEWVLKQQLNFIWMMVLFSVLSYLRKHCWELIERSQSEKAGHPSTPSAEPVLPGREAHAI